MIFFEKTLLFQKNKNLTHPRYTVNDYMGICVYSIDKIIGKKIGSQANAVLAIYGPRTTAILYNP